MTIFGEPIGTWISISALLISLSTILILLKKQKYDERIALAEFIAKIKNEYGEGIRIIDATLEEYDKVEKLGNESATYTGNNITNDKLKEAKTGINELKTRMVSLYKSLGYREPRTADPLILSAIIIESEGIKKYLTREEVILKNLIVCSRQTSWS